MASELLTLAKGVTPDSGGRERPYSRGRLRHQPVLPQCPDHHLSYFMITPTLPSCTVSETVLNVKFTLVCSRSPQNCKFCDFEEDGKEIKYVQSDCLSLIHLLFGGVLVAVKGGFCIIVDKSQGFWWGFYKSVTLENNDSMVCIKTPASFGDNMSVTLTRFGTLVITVCCCHERFFIELCQEVAVKRFNNLG